MNVRTIEIPGCTEFPELAGEAFTVCDTLTIYEAAMVYSDRHPGGQIINGTKNYERGEISDYESYLGKGARDGQRKLAWDIYCQLWKIIDAGEIKPVKTAYAPSGKLDPRDTRIATADIVKLAQARGETPYYLSLWKSRQAPDPSRPKDRVRSKLDAAVKRIEDAFPPGELPPAEMSNGKLYQLVTKSDGATPSFSRDTCKRARLALNRSK
jgi:hypothetical protein